VHTTPSAGCSMRSHPGWVRTSATLYHRTSEIKHGRGVSAILPTVRPESKAEERQRRFDFGVESIGGSPGEFAAAIGADILMWGQLINAAGTKEE